MPHPHRQSQHDRIVTQSVHTQLDNVMWSQAKTTTHLLPANSSSDSLDFREKNVGESDNSDQAAYYDYYAEAGQSGYAAGQNRLHQPQEMISVLFVLAFFWSGI